ncbi:MAG TPA: ABC transporter permease [Chthoniobacteraceae bacterium]|nr:ABC transporter permease [Chthoniobacteraceae bacterium]
MKTTLPRELPLVLALVLVFGLLALVAPEFFDRKPLMSRFAQEAPVLIVAAGTSLVIIVRQIDISVGSQFAVSGIVAGMLASYGAGVATCAAGALGAGLLMGAINGLCVATLRLPSIVVTLATMVIWREALRLTQQGQFINLPSGFQWFGLTLESGQMIQISAALALFSLLAWFASNVSAGRFIYAVGSDAEAARLSGIPPRITTFAAFVLLGGLCGIAAFMNALQTPQVDPKSGTGLEMKVIAASVVGGIAINGGRGRLWGAFLGLLVLTTISPALTYLHVEAYWEKAVQGSIILLAVIAETIRTRRV